MEFKEIVNGIPLILVVMGLVELTKFLGAGGKLLLALSMGIGCVLGVLYQMSIAIPVGFAGWFGVVIYGLALGLVASGIYDAIKSATKTG